MKIIKEGNIEKKVTCSYCNCEYEYNAKDICEDYQFFDYNLIYPTNYEQKVSKFVCCPECGEKYYIRKDIKPFVGDYLCSTTQEELNIEKKYYIKKDIKPCVEYNSCPTTQEVEKRSVE